MWTATTSASEYADFLRRLLAHITTTGPDGEVSLKATDELGRFSYDKIGSIGEREERNLSHRMRRAAGAIQNVSLLTTYYLLLTAYYLLLTTYYLLLTAYY